jgi:hypothetical protein
MRPAYALVVACIGCSPASAKVEVESGVYAAQLVACVETATTLVESKACRAKVTEAYHAAHNLPSPKDAGHE